MALRKRDTWSTSFEVTWNGTAAQLKQLNAKLENLKGGSRGVTSATATRSRIVIQWKNITNYNSAYNFVNLRLAGVADGWTVGPRRAG